MPGKIKSHSGAKKRIKQTRTGKVLRAHAYKNHFLSKKPSSRKRKYTQTSELDSSNKKQVSKLTGSL